MKGFVMLWQKTLDSSIWRRGTKDEKLVWVTLLMMKDLEGMVSSSVPGVADNAGVTDDECAAALEKFLAPDDDDTSGVEEGKKLRKVQGGWQVVNHEMYRFSTEAKREFWRQAKAEQRRKEEARKNREKHSKTVKAYSPEPALVKAANDGATQEETDQLEARKLAEHADNKLA